MSSNIINFNEALLKTNYNKNIYEFIKKIILDNFKYTQGKCEVFLTNSDENIFVIKHKFEITYNNILLPVNLLFYIPVDFPCDIPRLFFLCIDGVFINELYIENGMVDETTMEIFYNMIPNFSYTPFEMRVSELFDKIKEEFNKNFPLNKQLDKNNNYTGLCKFDQNNSIEVDFIEEYSNLDNIDDKRRQIKDKLLKIYDEVSLDVQITNSELLETDKKLDEEKILSDSITDNNFTDFKNLRDQLQGMKMSLLQELNDMKLINEGNIFENVDKLVFIKNKEKYKYTVMEKTEEEFLMYLKKGFEKKVVKFEELKDNTRDLSREIFYLKYIQSKYDN